MRKILGVIAVTALFIGLQASPAFAATAHAQACTTQFKGNNPNAHAHVQICASIWGVATGPNAARVVFTDTSDPGYKTLDAAAFSANGTGVFMWSRDPSLGVNTWCDGSVTTTNPPCIGGGDAPSSGFKALPLTVQTRSFAQLEIWNICHAEVHEYQFIWFDGSHSAVFGPFNSNDYTDCTLD